MAIFFLFDITELPLNLSRVLNEIEATKGFTTVFFGSVLIILWVFNRVYGYFIVIIKPLWFIILTTKENKGIYHGFFIALFTLYIMNIYWFHNMIKLFWKKSIGEYEKKKAH